MNSTQMTHNKRNNPITFPIKTFHHGQFPCFHRRREEKAKLLPPWECVLRSSVNVGSMKDIQTVKDSAKSYIGDLIRYGRWKKEAVRNQTDFPANSQGGGNSSDQIWCCYVSLLGRSLTCQDHDTRQVVV